MTVITAIAFGTVVGVIVGYTKGRTRDEEKAQSIYDTGYNHALSDVLAAERTSGNKEEFLFLRMAERKETFAHWWKWWN